MDQNVISVEHLSKQYDLGVIGTGTLSRDLNRWWALLRGKPDPYTRIGQRDHFERLGETILALDDVSFAVQKGEALGIIGKNGAGKSTLLKILSRVTAPTSGVVKVKGRIGSLLEVGTGFHPELTGRENVYLNGTILGMKKDEIARKFDEIVDFSGIEKFIDTPVKRYSSGMYVRLAFAVAAHLDPEILIVDEVLAVGDAEFQKKCMGKMGDVAGEGRTVLFVSHNLIAIEKLCDVCIYLKDGSIKFWGLSEESIEHYLSENGNRFELHSLDYYRKSDYQKKIIENIEVLSSNFSQRESFKIEEDIVIEINFSEKIKKIHNPFIGIGINNWQGTRIFTLMSYNSNTDEIWEDCDKIRCKISKPNLMPGSYFIKVSMNIEGKEQDVIIDYPAFEILPHDIFDSGRFLNKSQGVVINHAHWNYLNAK